MRIVENPKKEEKLIREIIKKYGHTPDHNFDWLMCCADEGEPQVAVFEDKYLIWCFVNKKEWVICTDPVAQTETHKKILSELINYLLSKNTDKIFFLDVRGGVNNFCKETYLDHYFIEYELVWPILNMEKFDSSLPGGHFKTIRNAKNKFYKENNIEIFSIISVNKKDLHEVVDCWKKHRDKSGIENIFQNRYHKMIDNNFHGTKSARAMAVNGKISGFNAGWETPNVPGDYSAAIGIHDFSTKDLGLALLLEDLEGIKKAGYKTCDLEGSEPTPLKFKMQFLPEKTYKTYSFYIIAAPKEKL